MPPTNLCLNVTYDGCIILDREGELDSLLIEVSRLFATKFDLHQVLVGCEEESDEVARNLARRLLAWSKVTMVERIVPEQIVAAMAKFGLYEMGFHVKWYRTEENGQKIYCLVAFDQNGHVILGDHVNRLTESEVANQPSGLDKSQSMDSITEATVYDQLSTWFGNMLYWPALSVFQSSDLRFAFMVNSRSIVPYVQACADYFALSITVKHEQNDEVTLLEESVLNDESVANMTTLEPLLDRCLPQSLLTGCALVFYISRDGHKLLVASVSTVRRTRPLDSPVATRLLSDADVTLLLLWWAIVRHLFELEIAERRHQPGQPPLNRPRAEMVLSKHLLNESKHLIRLAKRSKVVVRECESDHILASVESSPENKNKVVLAADGRRRYMTSNATYWDSVAVAVQLMQIGVLARAVHRCTVPQLIGQIKHSLGQNC